MNNKELIDYVNSVRKSPVQLVKHFDEVPASKRKYKMLGQIKYDGVWIGLLKQGDEVTCISRTGNVYKNTGWIEHLAKTALLTDGLFIGELVNGKLALEELSALVNTNRKKKLTADEAATLGESIIYMHDWVSIPGFKDGILEWGYFNRYPYMINNVLTDKLFRHVASVQILSEHEARKYAGELIKLGYEGAVFKQNCMWAAGHKGFHSMKVVREVTYDLECVGYTMGKTGKRIGQLATMQFRFKGGKIINADLGKGFLDTERLELTEQAQAGELDGTIWRVKGLQDGSKGSIRLPKVQEERFDKDQPDY